MYQCINNIHVSRSYLLIQKTDKNIVYIYYSISFARGKIHTYNKNIENSIWGIVDNQNIASARLLIGGIQYWDILTCSFFFFKENNCINYYYREFVN